MGTAEGTFLLVCVQKAKTNMGWIALLGFLVSGMGWEWDGNGWTERYDGTIEP